AGIFMMLEDQYGVGDVAEIGKITGTVEAVSLRITRVRDVSGVVWHIRNGTITQSGNESHGWHAPLWISPFRTAVTSAKCARSCRMRLQQCGTNPGGRRSSWSGQRYGASRTCPP